MNLVWRNGLHGLRLNIWGAHLMPCGRIWGPIWLPAPATKACADFLHSLEEMPGRARLALPDLDLPEILLAECGQDRFVIRCQTAVPGLARILVGILMAMADDYGALCVIEAEDGPGGMCQIAVRVLDTLHGEARRFELALPER